MPILKPDMSGVVLLAATLPEASGAVGRLAGCGPEVDRMPASAVQAVEFVARCERRQGGGDVQA